MTLEEVRSLFQEDKAVRSLTLQRKGERGGFCVARQGFRVIPEGKVMARKAGKNLQFQSVRFEGLLEVTDPERFLQTVREGIGAAKGFGFGLFSLAPAG